MLLARYAPVGTRRYEKLAQSIKSVDKIIEWIPAQLFGIWTIFVAGMSAGKAQTDRFYFWEFSDWVIGIISITVITLLIGSLGFKRKYLPINDISTSTKSMGYQLILAFILFTVGFSFFDLISIINAILYVIAYFAIYLIHTITYNNSEQRITSQNDKNTKTGIAILFLFTAGIIGYAIDNPLLSTGAIVSLPFLIVLFFGKHSRHLERAKFFPIFIFAMFVVSREGWFLIPLLILFFLLRSYNYLRYQKVFPSFGFSDDRD